MLRRVVLVTPATVFAAVAVKKGGGETPVPVAQVQDELAHFKCKPSELPLYAPLFSHNKIERETHSAKNSAAHDTLEKGISVIRTEVQTGYNAIEEKMKVIDEYFQTAKAHSQSTIDYLNQPQNVLPRSGAIAIGGLAGFIFAARGGFIKKVLYSTIGAGVIASLCYPSQAEQFARDSLYEARKGYAIAYNFVKGVKPGDEVSIEPISKFPANVQDLKNMALDFYDEAKEALFSKKQ